MKYILILFWSVVVSSILSQTCVTISDGTYGNTQTSPFAPLYGLYDYSWSSSIYYPSEIGGSKTIVSINWYIDEYQSGYSQTGPYTFSNIKIYFAYTTLSGWASTSNVSGINRLTGVNSAQGITSWTKVYDGSITFNTVNAWKSIALDVPFSYDGVTNLVVHVENWDGSGVSGYPAFHYTSTSASSLRTVKYGSQDASMGPTTGTRAYQRPDIKFCTTSALPIELLYFNPYYDEGKIKIKWGTASEKDNDYFTIEKSIDGNKIEVIDTIKAIGNSVGLVEYRSEDTKLNSSIIYYRLRQVDLNGDFTYSDWKSVVVGKSMYNITLHPNPFKDEINLNFDSKGDHYKKIIVTDLTDKVIYEDEVYVINGFNNIKINLENIPKGFYILNFDKVIFKIESY